jgi:hypothetical protein
MPPPPGSFTITFNLDQNLFALALASVFGAIGVAAMVAGVLGLRSTTMRPGFLVYARHRTAGVAGLDDVALCDVLLTKRRVDSWPLIFGGAWLPLPVVAGLAGSWLARGDFLAVTGLSGWGLTPLLLIGLNVLLVAGQAYGVHRERARAAGQPVDGGPRLAHSGEPVPRWYVLAYAAGVALLWAQALIALPFLRAHLTTRLLGGEMVLLPLGRAIALALPAVAILAALIGMALLRWERALPEVRYCADPRQSAEIEAGFRKEAVWALLLQSAQTQFFLMIGQFMLLLNNIPLGRFDFVPVLVMLPFTVAIAGGYLALLLKMIQVRQPPLFGAPPYTPRRLRVAGPAAPAPRPPDRPVS